MARTTKSSVTWTGVLPEPVRRPLTVVIQSARLTGDDL